MDKASKYFVEVFETMQKLAKLRMSSALGKRSSLDEAVNEANHKV